MELYPPHICQSDEWGEFKSVMGTNAIKAGKVLLTLHPLPHSSYNVGYCARAVPENINISELFDTGVKHHCTHIKIDVPNAPAYFTPVFDPFDGRKTKPTFATATFMVDLSRSEDELIEKMHHKTRYNIKLAQKKGVEIKVNSDIETFLKLQKETATRQKFFIHPDNYYRTLFEMLSANDMAHLVSASYNNESLSSLFLIKYKDTLYYPYGGSSLAHRELMAPTLNMWEAIRFGQKIGCKQFDMWGALESADANPAWAGFHRFKEGFGGTLVKYPGSWDLVINPKMYNIFQVADKIRWSMLRLTRR